MSDNKTLPLATKPKEVKSFAVGAAIIKKNLKTLSNKPGVYRMLGENEKVLYVGKAKDLTKRVQSYTRQSGLSNRIARMVSATKSMVFIETHTEAEALLLEANLIKTLKPSFNVLLRDDKSFPYILLRTNHPWVHLTKHRGAKKKDGKYFGPFASAAAVTRTLNTMQRVFLLRTCTDTVFDNRSRPCLLFQIKRCSGPCVDRISKQDYSQLVDQAVAFLEGRETSIQKGLAEAMETASETQEYEKAAGLRDRLSALTQVQSHQNINARHVGNADIIAAHQIGGQTAIQVFFYRVGQNWGNHAFFPRHDKDEPLDKIIAAFISQFYDNKPAPGEIIVSTLPEDTDLMAEALSLKADRKVKINQPKRGERKALMMDAVANAKSALMRHLAEKSSQTKLLDGVKDLFELDNPPNRIEVYDNSHISGTNALGAMIVSGPDGFQKNAYRKFNIKNPDTAPGDDFAMMREVLTRRFKRLVKEDPDRTNGMWPDVILIDGGKGQLSTVMDVAQDLGVDDLCFVGISKGPDRNAGREQFHMPGRETFMMEANHPVLYFLQRLRDEAHRFAIGSHRSKRAKTIKKSALDQVPGIGAKRKRALLNHFGSAKEVENAGLEDLKAVDGISEAMAENIYDYFHDGG
jgi:excinuclease ABC subunit C